jgi:hypothetical protein
LLARFLPPETKASSWIDNSRMRKPFLFAGEVTKKSPMPNVSHNIGHVKSFLTDTTCQKAD